MRVYKTNITTFEKKLSLLREERVKLNTVFNNSVSDDVTDILTERLSKNQHLSDVLKKKVKTNQDKLEPLLRKGELSKEINKIIETM